MTAERLDDDQVGQRLTQVLDAEANTIDVRDDWDVIASRLIELDRSSPLPSPVANRRRRPMLGEVAMVIGAAALVLAVVLGWRPAALTPAPVAPATTSVPRYDASIPTLVVYRRTGGEDRPQGAPARATFTITPERMRTDSPDVGQAALEAMFNTAPIQRGSTPPGPQKFGRADIASVTVSGGIIRVELNSFYSPLYAASEAHAIAQAWVRTLQDTLGVRNDVVIRLQGQPFSLYGAIDTAKPLARDESVRVVRLDGFDSPRAGDVTPRTFVLLGSATTAPGQPARVQIVNLDTTAIAHEQEVAGPADRAASIDFEPVLTLEPGRYRATMSGRGAVSGVRDITFTVVS